MSYNKLCGDMTADMGNFDNFHTYKKPLQFHYEGERRGSFADYSFGHVKRCFFVNLPKGKQVKL